MRFHVLTVSRHLLVLTASLGLTACGGLGGGGNSSITGYMAASWDFTVTNAKGRVPYVVEANLTQDHHGNISGAGSVTANGPTGNVFDMSIWGTSLSTTYAVSVDYLGFSCNGTDSGDRSISGTINSSNQVTLNWNIGGSGIVTITGTLNNSASPPFTGTVTSSGACAGSNATVVGTIVTLPSSNYSGTSSVDSTENIVVALTNNNGSLTGSGSDSKLGNFTLTGNAVAYAFSGTLTYASSPANNGPVFGYYDPKLGPAGSILLVSFAGANVTNCPNGEPGYQYTCQIATLAAP